MIMNQHALVLIGKKGEKIIRKIYNGPKVPYEKLMIESEEIKKQWKTAENDKNIGTAFEVENTDK